MEKNIYIMRWYGPFADMESARDWDRTHHIPCCLYLMSGMKKYAKSSVHYYIGKAERNLITDRFKDKNHHINDFSRIKEIWLGSVANKKATHDDVMLIENMLTSYFVGEVGKDRMLNMRNFCLPASNVYVLSEWINPYSELAWGKLSRNSPANIVADVIVNKANDNAFNYYLYVSKKLKKQEKKQRYV